MKIYSEDKIVPSIEKFYTTNNNNWFLDPVAPYYLAYEGTELVVTGFIPNNFYKLLSMTLIVLADATGGDDDQTLYFTAAGIGENREAKQDTATRTSNIPATGPFDYVDFTVIDPGVEPGDCFGLFLETDVGVVNHAIGAVLKYRPLRPVQ